MQAECLTIQWHPTTFSTWRNLTLASHKIAQNGFGILNAYVKHQGIASKSEKSQVNTLHPLHVCGQFLGYLKRKEVELQQEVYVVKRFRKPLLGCPAIKGLGVVSQIKQAHTIY